MKAIDVYEQNKRDIKIISDAMRKEGKPGHIENIGVFIGSAQPFEPDLEILSSQIRRDQITDEQATSEMKTRLAKSYHDEQEILNYYQKYKDSHCGKIIKTLS